MKIINIVIRVIFDCVLFLSIFTTSWWVSVFLACLGGLFFSRYLELLIFGVLIEVVYATSPEGQFWRLPYVSILSFGVYFGAVFLKSKMR